MKIEKPDHMITANSTKSHETRVRQLDWLAVISFLLAFFIMVLPLEVDVLTVLLGNRQLIWAGAVAAGCFVVVFTPLLLSLRGRKREPQARRGGGYLIATGVVLTLNVLFVGSVFVYQLLR